MGEKQCGKCGEMVDEAKAFCPGCGNSFVEEKERTSVSDFDLSDNTVRLGDTMYNQMLSDMGLSISKQPKRDDKQRTEAIAPAVPTPPAAIRAEQRVEPPKAIAPERRSTIIWVAVIVVLAATAIVVAAVVAVAALLYFR